MAAIFLSYRRDDTGIICDHVALRLAAKFGQNSVFRDASAIYVGSDWERTLRSALEDCYVVIALIGLEWAGSQGRSRLNEPGDFVRLELATALAQHKRVVPVLANGGRMPQRHELPPDLAALANIPPLTLRPTPDFDADMQAILTACQPAVKRRLPHPVLLASGVVGALGLLAALALPYPSSLASLAIVVAACALAVDLIGSISLCVSALQTRAWIWFALGLVALVPPVVLAGNQTMDPIILIADGLLAPAVMIAFGLFGPRRLWVYAPARQPIRGTRWFAGGCALVAGALLSYALFQIVLAGGATSDLVFDCLVCCVLLSVVGTVVVGITSLMSARGGWFLALVVVCLLTVTSVFAFAILPNEFQTLTAAVLCLSLIASVITLGLFAFLADRHIITSRQREGNAHATHLSA